MRGIKPLALLLTIVVMFSFSSAVKVGVSPANIRFDNVLRGGYAERPFTVTIESEAPVEVITQLRGEIADWINLSEANFSVSRSNPKQIMVSVTPPADTPNGNYSGFIRVKSSPLGQALEGAATGVVIPALDLYVEVTVTDEEFVQCRASDFVVSTVEEGDEIIFTMKVRNDGNIRLSPEIAIDIWDRDSIDVVKSFSYTDTEIVPTRQADLVIRVPSEGLSLGQYWADVSAIECLNTQTLTFDVLEEGALRANGNLDKILVKTWADIGDIIPINAVFSNNGEKPLTASFSGEITRGGKIIRLLESDEDIFVPIGDSGEFQFYYTPREAGRYIISGRAYYDSKKTYEESAVLNVRASNSWMYKYGRPLGYLVLVLLISYLIFKIRTERRKYQSKFRRVNRR